MPKTIFTPRDELICGKIDDVINRLCLMGDIPNVIDCIYLMRHIKHDAERMEAKLVEYKYNTKKPCDLKTEQSVDLEIKAKE